MRRIGALPVTLGVAVALTACSVDGPLPAAPASIDHQFLSTKAPQRLTPSATPVPLLSTGQTAGMESTPWQLLDEHQDWLRIRYVSGGACRNWQGVRVAETPHSVEIWTVVRPPNGDPACILTYNTGSTEVRLQMPLGRRQLLHAPVSNYWTSLDGRF